jgi:tetratricopeptide (TPR) repeat protein
MKGWRLFVAVFSVLALTVTASAQLGKIVIPAGTPEDQAIQTITNEGDAQKRIPMWQDFVQKFPENKQAVAFGNWQLSQLYSATGDNAKALEYGDKAVAAMPNNLDILVANAGIAQQMKDNAKVMDYATSGGQTYNGLGKQPKPEGMTDEQFASNVAQDKDAAQQSYQFLEASAYNVVSGEQDPKARLGYAQQFADAFPQSQFLENVNAFALMSVQQMNNPQMLNEFAEKALAKNPNSLPTLILLANAFSEDQNPSSAAKAVTYARKAIELAKADEPGADSSRKLSAGVAHSALGYALMKQEKTPQAITELKTAAAMLKENPAAYSTVMYRLGFAYAKTKQYAEAKTVLTEGSKVEGPFQQASKDLLEKVTAAGGKRAATKP